ncbi:MAG: diacylglycerol kinase family protein [Ferruginibacter sp.]
MSRKIIYFINPISGTRGKEALIKKIEEKTALQNIPFEILPTNAEGNYFFLKEKIRNEDITDIVICGGDGTVNTITGSLLEEDVSVGIIPMGSGNGLALAAKIPKQTDKALDLIFTGKATYIDSFFINDIFSCMLCGLGFDAQVAHDFARQPKRGLATYIKQTLINFINIRPWTFEIVNKGKSLTVSAYFMCIANGNQFGNQFTIAPRAKLHDGLLDIVIVKKMSRIGFIWSVFRQVRNGRVKEYTENNFRKTGVVYFQTDKLIINNPAGAPLHIDGDPSDTSKKLTIEIIPDAFKLIQPKIK